MKVWVERELKLKRRRKNLFTVEFLEEQLSDDPLNDLFDKTKKHYDKDAIFAVDDRINLKPETGDMDDEAHEAWAQVFDEQGYADVHAWLRRHPEAWDSLRVLEDLLGEIREIEPTRWLDSHVYVPLLARARQVMDAALAGAKPADLPWGFPGNRPWHRLAFWRMEWLTGEGRPEAAIAACEEMLAWNPGDNQGVRYSLAALHAQAGRFADLLALCERGEKEGGAVGFNRALALHALERKGDALGALAEAHKASPRFLKFLLAENPRPPKPDRFGIEPGGDYEAWLYRQAMLAAWETTGALEWARACLPALKRLR